MLIEMEMRMREEFWSKLILKYGRIPYVLGRYVGKNLNPTSIFFTRI